MRKKIDNEKYILFSKIKHEKITNFIANFNY